MKTITAFVFAATVMTSPATFAQTAVPAGPDAGMQAPAGGASDRAPGMTGRSNATGTTAVDTGGAGRATGVSGSSRSTATGGDAGGAAGHP